MRPIAGALLGWFARNRRALPWRTLPRDPYRVWLAEVMLQQTQVDTVIPYFERWLARFPTLAILADATVDDVLRVWEGLGYYARARNFHRAARIVSQAMGGVIPSHAEALRALPGVGRYTAGAIASLAFARDEAALDANARRVLSRIHGLVQPGDAQLWQLAQQSLPAGQAGPFNEALMDLGALVCTPRAPACEACPLERLCAARAGGEPERFPARRTRSPIPQQDIGTLIAVSAGGRVLARQRPAEGLLGGLWEFPSAVLAMESNAPLPSPAELEALGTAIARDTGVVLDPKAGDFVMIHTHTFTHLRWRRHVALIHGVSEGTPNSQCCWMSLDDLEQHALTRSDRRILAALAPRIFGD